MIQKILWKNLQAVQLENKFLRVVVIPQLGGKVASVFEKEKEFELTAQNAAERYDLPESDADFSVFDASGIDDTFPNINEEIYRDEGSEYHYPDHGEVWSSNLNWNAQEDVLHLWYESERFFYLYEKWIFLEENQLCIRYRICNLSEKKLPCIWTFHGLMRYEEGMELIYPNECEYLENVLDGPELGNAGVVYPIDTEHYCFYTVPPQASLAMVKYYVSGQVQEGRCGYRYPSRQVECILHYDERKLPYLGMWITAGGFRGDYNCAFEPSNGYYDAVSIAKKKDALYYLQKEQPLCFELRIEVKHYLEGNFA